MAVLRAGAHTHGDRTAFGAGSYLKPMLSEAVDTSILPSERHLVAHVRSLVIGAAAFCLVCSFAFDEAAAQSSVVDDPLKSVRSVQEKSDYGLGNGSFLVAPIPFSNPVVGAGLALGGGYLFQLDPEADTSFVGLGALASDNGSSAIGTALNLSFGNGWRFDFALVDAELRYDLFLGQLEVPIEQDGTLLNSGFDYKISKTISVGAAFRYLDSTIGLRNSETAVPPELLPDLGLELMSLGGRIEWDVRDDGDYPTQGALFSIAANRGSTLSGPARSYGYGSANFDVYNALSDTSVLAGRLSTCAASENAPFFDKCSIGFSDAFRGFSPTEFYDTRMASAQIEVRQRLGNRWGVVAFGGIGWTGSSYGSLTEDGDRIAGGFGVRYRVSQQFPIDFSVDVSRNNDSEEFLYIYVGQRF